MPPHILYCLSFYQQASSLAKHPGRITSTHSAATSLTSHSFSPTSLSSDLETQTTASNSYQEPAIALPRKVASPAMATLPPSSYILLPSFQPHHWASYTRNKVYFFDFDKLNQLNLISEGSIRLMMLFYWVLKRSRLYVADVILVMCFQEGEGYGVAIISPFCL